MFHVIHCVHVYVNELSFSYKSVQRMRDIHIIKNFNSIFELSETQDSHFFDQWKIWVRILLLQLYNSIVNQTHVLKMPMSCKRVWYSDWYSGIYIHIGTGICNEYINLTGVYLVTMSNQIDLTSGIFFSFKISDLLN